MAAILSIPGGVGTLQEPSHRHPGARRMASGVDDLLASTIVSKTCNTDRTVLSMLPHTEENMGVNLYTTVYGGVMKLMRRITRKMMTM